MNILKVFYEFITNKAIKMSHKMTAIIIGLTLLFFIDNYYGLSFHLKVNNKMQELSRVDDLISTSRDSTIIEYAQVLRAKILNRKTIWECLASYSTWASWNSKKDPVAEPKKKPLPESFLGDRGTFILTSGLFYFLIGLISLFGILFAGDDDQTKINVLSRIASAIVIAVIFFIVGMFHAFLFGFIPKIGNNWSVNYAINVLLQAGSLFFITKKLSDWLVAKRDAIIREIKEDIKPIDNTPTP